MMPPQVAQIRRSLCRCPEVNHDDPCAACPNGHFGAYTTIGCEAAPPPAMDDPPRPAVRRHTAQPGDLLALLILKVTGQVSGTCACAARQQQMNQWGWLGCFRHRKIILGWLREEAAMRGHVINQSDFTSLFRAAWKELKAEQSN